MRAAVAAFVQGANIRVGGVGDQLGKMGGCFGELWPEAGGSMQTPVLDIRGPSWDEDQLPAGWMRRAELSQRVEPPQEGACHHDPGVLLCAQPERRLGSWAERPGDPALQPAEFAFLSVIDWGSV